MPVSFEEKIKVEADGYRWRDGCHVKVKPDDAVVELRRIYQAHKGVTPALVVEAARPDESLLHDEFEWSDAEAARTHREEQARHLLRSLLVVYRRPDGTKTQPVRAYVKIVPSADDPSLDDATTGLLRPHVYLPIRQVMDEPDLRRRLRQQAYNELVTWRQRYRGIDTFAALFDQIDALKAVVDSAS